MSRIESNRAARRHSEASGVLRQLDPARQLPSARNAAKIAISGIVIT